ncbi:gag-pol polyprotein [Trichonephila clavipes]|nr:gag-pol polyprotein [Trichonephila clavipes]
MIEGHVLILYTDHKPLTFVFNQKLGKASPHQLCHLDFILQFTTDIRYIPGIDNVPADAFSGISGIVTPSTIDYDKFAQMQQGDDELKALLFATNPTFQLKQLRMPGSTTKIYCDISIGTTCSCISCQRVKTQQHANSELGHFKVPDTQFHDLHLDIIGPLPPYQGFSYCPTAIDHFSRWPEAYPTSDMTATVIRNYVCACLRISKIRTTPYHPSSNGLVEHTHRSLMAHATPHWTQVLPFVLLGLRSVIKEDINATELVYGTTICLLSDFWKKSRVELSQYTHIFLQHDALRKPLQPPYAGPFTVVKRSEKLITLLRQGKEICISIDRVKPALMLSDTMESNQPSVIPKTQEVPATKSTCSGRRVHFPQRYMST